MKKIYLKDKYLKILTNIFDQCLKNLLSRLIQMFLTILKLRIVGKNLLIKQVFQYGKIKN